MKCIFISWNLRLMDASTDSLRDYKKYIKTFAIGERTTECAFSDNPLINYNLDKSVNTVNMNAVCPFWKDLKWENDASGLCCKNGKVFLKEVNDPSEPLLSGDNSEALHFQKLIRHYNSYFQMASFGSTGIV